MLSNKPVGFLLSFCILLITACTSEIGNSKDVNQETIYQQYRMTYDEADSQAVEVYAQFRFAGENGTTLVLSAPSTISFDGKELAVDSTQSDGAFYKQKFPAAGFFSNHQFLFKDVTGKQFANKVTFDSFQLVERPQLARKDAALSLRFNQLSLRNDDIVEVSTMDSDSTFSLVLKAGDGNSLVIPAKELQRQKGNSLKLDIYHYKSIPLQQHTKEGGEMMLVYHLKPVDIRFVNDSTEVAIRH